MEDAMSVENVIADYNELSPDQQEQVQKSVFPGPSPRVANGLWVVVFATLAGVIFVGGAFAIKTSGSDETALYGFVGIALGAVAGLLAPGPTKD
jgi:hypothetical protein